MSLTSDNKLFLFDIDGTLVESSKKINSKHTSILTKLKEKYDIGVVGGGVLNKNLEQFGDNIYFHHYLTECGCVYYKNKSNDVLDLEKIYIKDIRKHPIYLQINELIKHSLFFISQTTYTVSGHFIDLRNGLVYVSLIGMSANDDERKYFMDLDSSHHIRKELMTQLVEKSKELDIFDKITICEGGHVGIAIYPTEYDKEQVVELFKGKYDEIHYFGDKYEKNGNDYKLINNEHIIGHKVDDFDETYDILLQYI
jgi:phosphomannomutase